MSRLKSPYIYFGGKSLVADVIWQRLGWDVGNFVDPFMGSNAVLLGRPNWNPRRNWIETVNDLDGFIPNFWRAIRHNPDAVVEHATYHDSEVDYHARQSWLVGHKKSIVPKLEGDPNWYSAKIAGWWVWGLSQMIGTGYCEGGGPWIRAKDAKGNTVLRKARDGEDRSEGIGRYIINLGGGNGIGTKTDTLEWMRQLSARLAKVRVCCGDWSRVCTFIPTTCLGLTAVILDPPYGGENARDTTYTHDSLNVAADVRTWCRENGSNELLRIALCGYDGEHNELESLGWSVHKWKAQGGYGNQGKTGTDGKTDNKNRHKERIWFSPHCISSINALPIFAAR